MINPGGTSIISGLSITLTPTGGQVIYNRAPLASVTVVEPDVLQWNVTQEVNVTNSSISMEGNYTAPASTVRGCYGRSSGTVWVIESGTYNCYGETTIYEYIPVDNNGYFTRSANYGNYSNIITYARLLEVSANSITPILRTYSIPQGLISNTIDLPLDYTHQSISVELLYIQLLGQYLGGTNIADTLALLRKIDSNGYLYDTVCGYYALDLPTAATFTLDNDVLQSGIVSAASNNWIPTSSTVTSITTWGWHTFMQSTAWDTTTTYDGSIDTVADLLYNSSPATTAESCLKILGLLAYNDLNVTETYILEAYREWRGLLLTVAGTSTPDPYTAMLLALVFYLNNRPDLVSQMTGTITLNTSSPSSPITNTRGTALVTYALASAFIPAVQSLWSGDSNWTSYDLTRLYPCHRGQLQSLDFQYYRINTWLQKWIPYAKYWYTAGSPNLNDFLQAMGLIYASFYLLLQNAHQAISVQNSCPQDRLAWSHLYGVNLASLNTEILSIHGVGTMTDLLSIVPSAQITEETAMELGHYVTQTTGNHLGSSNVTIGVPDPTDDVVNIINRYRPLATVWNVVSYITLGALP